MVTFTLVNGKKVTEMVRALIFGLMVTNILEIGMKIKDMVRAHKLVHLETST